MPSTPYPAARVDGASSDASGCAAAEWQAPQAHVVDACIVPTFRRAPGAHSGSGRPPGELHVGRSVGSGSGSVAPARQHRHGV